MVTTGWKLAAALLLGFVLSTSVRGAALADSTRVAVGPSPVLYVQMQSGTVNVHTWNQPQVQFDGDAGVTFRHAGGSRAPRSVPQQLYLWSQTIRTPDGSQLELEPEPFVLPDLNGNGPHDAVIVQGAGNAALTIPSGTALIVANVRRGSVAIDGYRNGVFVAHIGGGSLELNNFSGTGAAQVNNGFIHASNSDFTRLRVRTARGNMEFENCNATQIQATSLTGSIFYDNGSFAPGLARFESERGDVVLGVAGNGVQVGAHSSAGRIYTDASNVHEGATDALTTLGRGGPVVTATSGTGSVIFYNGALRDHPKLQRRFRPRRRLQQKPP